jgi:C4-dicarboxylate transporter DctQ subunit
MRGLIRVHDWVVTGLAGLGGFVLTTMFLAIVYDVTVRTIGIPSPLWTVTLAEYALLHSTLYATPWVLRRKSHVFITIFISRLSSRPKLWAERLVYVAGIAICSVLAYFSLSVVIDEYIRGFEDIRSFAMPGWIVTAPVPLAFILLALEFARFLFGSDSMLSEDQAGAGGI